MHPPLRIEVPDESHAHALRRQLRPFGVNAVAVDDHYEVHVDLIARNPESRITTALHAIDLWLLTAGLASVQVHIDGTTYSIHAPTAPSSGRASPLHHAAELLTNRHYIDPYELVLGESGGESFKLTARPLGHQL